MAIIINPAVTHQTIDGFGCQPVWMDILTDAEADLWWGDAGLKLSICRLASWCSGTLEPSTLPAYNPPPGWNLPYTVGEAQWGNLQKAIARGVTRVHCGGQPIPDSYRNFDGEFYTDVQPGQYAQLTTDMLAFASYLAGRGTAITSIASAGEVDSFGTFSAAQALSFHRNHFGPAARAAVAPGVLIHGPGTLNNTNLRAYYDPILADPAAAATVDVVQLHGYGVTLANAFRYSEAIAAGKRIWVEEDSDYDAPRGDLSMARALQWAEKWHAHLAIADVSGYIWFWPWRPSWFTSAEADGLWGPPPAKTVGKQFWAFANFTRFIRPGYQRVAATGAPAGVLASAYVSPGGDLVVVAINQTAAPINITLEFPSGSLTTSLPASSVTTFTRASGTTNTAQYRTSASEDLASLSHLIRATVASSFDQASVELVLSGQEGASAEAAQAADGYEVGLGLGMRQAENAPAFDNRVQGLWYGVVQEEAVRAADPTSAPLSALHVIRASCGAAYDDATISLVLAAQTGVALEEALAADGYAASIRAVAGQAEGAVALTRVLGHRVKIKGPTGPVVPPWWNRHKRGGRLWR